RRRGDDGSSWGREANPLLSRMLSKYWRQPGETDSGSRRKSGENASTKVKPRMVGDSLGSDISRSSFWSRFFGERESPPFLRAREQGSTRNRPGRRARMPAGATMMPEPDAAFTTLVACNIDTSACLRRVQPAPGASAMEGSFAEEHQPSKW